MRKKKMTILGALLLSCALLGGCAGGDDKQEPAAETPAAEAEAPAEETEAVQEETDAPAEETPEEAELPDGVYTAKFTTDSTMFQVNETYEDMGTLTVQDGEMTIHITLGSKKIVNLYPGLAEDAAKDGAQLLEPTTDSVTYSDGLTEEVYGFDVPVPYLDEEFDLALIGTKGKWYDHKVSVSDPQPMEEGSDAKNAEGAGASVDFADGTYTVELDFAGGSGKAQIASPAQITVADGVATATVEWSSPNYDYMIVDGEKYLPVNTEGNSVFEIPVLVFDEPMEVIGDTVAMSTPHEIEYTLTFRSDTMKTAE